MNSKNAAHGKAGGMPSLSGRVSRYIADNVQVLRLICGQVLFVWLSFAVMAVTTYFFINDIMQQHLLKSTEDALSYTQATIASDLAEPEMLVKNFSQSVRTMILNGNRAQVVHEYVKSISNDVIKDKRRKLGMNGIYGYFDVFGGLYLHDGSGTPPADYVPQQRPWYTAAVAAKGEVAATPPYMDARRQGIVMSYSRRIFDDNGYPLAVISLDVPLEKIAHYITEAHLARGGYGLLLSEHLDVIAHKDTSQIGRAFGNINSQAAAIAADLKNGMAVLEREMTNYRGEASIVSFRRLANGWYLGIMTPIDEYYCDARTMVRFLLTLGVLLATMLSMVLLHIAAANAKTAERARIMFDSTPLGSSFWDEKYNPVDCNQEMVKLFELSSKQEFLDRFFELSPPYQPCGTASREKAMTFIRRAFAEGYCRFEWMHQNLHGEPMPSEITLVRVQVKNNFIVASYIRDLRELKAMLHEIHRIEIVEASNRAKSKFLATMSHEIRTPMNAILGITEIQLQNEMLSRDAKEAFSKIYSSGYTLLGIINDILDLSRIEAGKMELMPAKYEIVSLISDTAHLNATRIGDKPIEFKIEVDENMPLEMYGDELRIKQILNNMLSNAFKYTKAGAVTLSVAAECGNRRESPEVTLVCSVSDTGQGMTEEQVRNLFNEYSRFNLEANRLIEGTGLGMNITQHLVHLMRGEIFVESAPDKGSTFTIRLPQKNIGTGVLGKELAEHLRSFDLTMQRMKITPIVREPMPYGSVLIVDDLETNLYVAKGLMAPYNLLVDTALSGFETIDKIKSGNVYDIVFMDHMMPKMDGLEATKILRDLGYAHPVIALTANAVVGQAEMFLENGFDGFISKPIDLRQLNALLNRLIRDKQPPEVIDAARRQKDGPYVGVRALQSPLDPQLARVFVRDAEKTIAALEAIYMNKCRRDDDVQMFVINIHAMKSALANIGEPDLAVVALTLEQAGREENIAVMLAETPAFLNALRAVIAKLTPKKDDEASEAVDEDPPLLRETLLAIQAACAAHDKIIIKTALAGLQQKTWSPQTREDLNAITEQLLHSDFEEAANVAENTIRRLS